MIPPLNEKEIEPLDLPKFLADQDLFPKFYWKCRKTGIETAALGSLMDLFEIPPSSLPYKFYGAISFPNSLKDPLWNNFPSPFFFLPQVEIEQSPFKTLLKIRGSAPLFNDLLKDLSDSPKANLESNLPDKTLWESLVNEVLRSIENKELEKVVLARMSSFSTQDPPFSWLKKLLISSKNSTVFALQKTEHSLFLGASPEMLYERKGQLIKTESIAGTRKKTDLTCNLQESKKDNKEFSYVKNFLSHTLCTLCERFSHDPLDSLVETSHLKHLYNRFEGTLKPGISDLDLISSLHPTPAVGGFPQKTGVTKISSLEPFDRGLYAGALGWISPEEASFAVAIRSALVVNGLLHAFAGTGIVKGSEPQKEWNELNDKISHWGHV